VNTTLFPQRQQNLLALLAIVLVGIVLYAGSLRGGFLSDDYDWFFLVESADYAAFDVMETAGSGLYFRPLITLSLRLERAIAGGVSPFIHHLSNLLIHLATACIVYLSCRVLNGHTFLSLALALCFLLHPAVVPDVYWIAARVDSLMAFFYLLGVLGYLHFLRSGRPLWLILAAAGFIGGLLTKEMAVTFPLVLLVIYLLFKLGIVAGARLPDRSPWPLRSLVVFFLATAAYLLFIYTRFYRPAGQTFPAFSPVDALEALVASFVLLVYPNNQSSLIALYRSYPWLLLLGLLLLAAVLLVGFTWLYRRGGRRPLLLVALVAVLYLATLPPLLLSGVESRQMYLPLAVLSLALAILPALGQSPTNRMTWASRLAWFLYSLAFVLAFVSYQHGRTWVENSQLAQSYCQSFRTATPDLSAESPILLLAVPAESRHIPLFANDANATLYYCRFGRFGYFPQLLYVGALFAEQAAPGENEVSLTQEQPNTFHLSLPPAGHYFYFGTDLNVGDRLVAGDDGQWPPMNVTIDALHGRDRVTAFTFTLDSPENGRPIQKFHFDGSQFIRLRN
jgi:hypothetical protein